MAYGYITWRGPEGEKSYCRVDFKTIEPYKSFTSVDAFCDENGIEDHDFPSMGWKNEFAKTETGCIVKVEISFAEVADLQKILDLGFEEGFTSALSNLDELLKTDQVA